MPTKKKTYHRIIFTPEVIKEAREVLEATLPHEKRKLRLETLEIELSSGEEWAHDSEEEFFADYRKGFEEATFRKCYEKADMIFHAYLRSYEQFTRVSIEMPSRTDVEKVFNVLESNVEKCRLPREPQKGSKAKTDWITETINKVEGRCPIAGRKLKLALIKLDSEEAEEWQNATMLIRDAWIELTQWLCQVNNIDTSDIPPDAVIDMLRKLKIDETDDRLFNLARASFNLYAKHHKRDIDQDTVTACVISTLVSMQTVIREAFNATS
jgi:hypothetical protein